MESPSVYIPMDRRHAIASGVSLAQRTHGAALFADISGFTPLTETLLNEYGPKRGAEELTRQLNQIYDALVIEVHRFGGSVMAFSGDAITCWLDRDDGRQAIACGLAMQAAMQQFAAIRTPSGQTIPLAMKVGLAVGPVRRFQIGDPKIQYIDALAGATLDQMADAEHHAEKGEVVVSGDVIEQLDHLVEVAVWRQEPGHTERFAVVAGFTQAQLQTPWPAIPPDRLTDEQTRSWVLPPVYARLQAGKGQFLAELRPAVSLFLSFGGIDFDRDEAASEKLDAYIRWVQNILFRYDGYLLQLTIGDKGCYLYSAFGAPAAHEDDAVRAISSALELVNIPAEFEFVTDVKIGISQGQMRTGAYGGSMRRTYGVLGDEVNMSARLMQAADPWQILVKHTVWQATGGTFTGEQLPPFTVKGKTEPVIAYSIKGLSHQASMQLQHPRYTLPMVGRQAELGLIQEKAGAAGGGSGQIIAVIAEAGMGKSRLVAEAIEQVAGQRFRAFGGECQSYGTANSYLVWQPIWSSFFGLDPAWNDATKLQAVEQQLQQINPELLPRLPLLGPVLNLSIADNELTQSFDAKLRKESLESLLVACLRAGAKESPLLLVLEDCHWLDPLSHDLVEVVGRAITDLPVLMILAYRPLQLERLREARVEKLPHFTEIRLTEFTTAEATQLIRLKLAQFFGEQSHVPAALIRRITERSQGNPFYIEELLNYLQDQGLTPQDFASLEQLDLPDSLHSLILSRIDKLTEQQKSTIKVASVIGRLFEAGWLWGMYPELGDPDQIIDDLNTTSQLDLTPLDKPEPELAYIFKHIVTQEVAYESLPYAMRAILHDQLGQYIEQKYSDHLEQYVFLLAFHYERSENQAKKRTYFHRAGQLAQAEYSNEAALDYFRRLLPFLDRAERVPVLINSGEVLMLTGEYTDALTYYTAARFLIGDETSEAPPELLAELCRKTADVYDRLSDYETALEWLTRGLDHLNAGAPVIEAARLYNSGAGVYRRQGNYDEAIDWCERALRVAREIDHQEAGRAVGQAYYLLGYCYWRRGDLEQGLHFCNESVRVYQTIDDLVGLSNAYLNLSNVYSDQGQWTEASDALRESLTLKHKIGDVFGQGMTANNLAYILMDGGVWEQAANLFEESRAIWQQLGSTWGEAVVLSNLAQVRIYQKNWGETLRCLQRSEALFTEIGSEEYLPELERRWGEYYLGIEALPEALAHTVRSVESAKAQEARLEEGMSYRVLGQIHLARQDIEQADAALHQSWQILKDLKSEYEAAKTVLPLTRLALTAGVTQTHRANLEQASALFEKLGAQADLTQAQALMAELG